MTPSLLTGDSQDRHLQGVGPRNIVALLGSYVQLNCSDKSSVTTDKSSVTTDKSSVTTSSVWRKTQPCGTVVNISNTEDKHNITHDSLLIFNVSHNDSGIYTCVKPGSNETGEVHVTVLGEHLAVLKSSGNVRNNSYHSLFFNSCTWLFISTIVHPMFLCFPIFAQ